MCKCPTCGQELPASEVPVTALLEVAYGGIGTNIVAALVDVYPRGMRLSALVDDVWGHDPNGGPDAANNAIHVTLYRIRPRMEQLGWTVSKPGPGKREAVYRIMPFEKPIDS